MTAAASSSNAAAPGASAARLHFEPLRAWAPVSLRRTACLAMRMHDSACRACADACPTQALSVAGQQVELNGACTGCGRCQGACPMGALSVAGFDAVTAPSAARGQTLVVDCERGGTGEPGALRVPCLGGVSDGRLLALCAGTPDAAVVLVDRGECASCDSACGGEHPARAIVQRVATLMREAGVPDERLPRIEDRARNDRRAGWRVAVDPLQSRGRARRGLFTALAQPLPPAAARTQRLAASAPSAERRLQLGALRSLAERHHGRLPATAFHSVEIGAACRGHRVCASACPTGALLRYRDESAARIGVAFDAIDCIGCGHCAQACPEQALTVRRGAGDPSSARRLLSGFAQRECPNCGTRFAARDEEEHSLCDRCRKSARLAQSAFRSLFGARP